MHHKMKGNCKPGWIFLTSNIGLNFKSALTDLTIYLLTSWRGLTPMILYLVIQFHVHEIAMHVRSQQISAHQMRQTCNYVRMSHDSHETRDITCCGLTQIAQILGSDKLVILVHGRFRIFLKFFCQIIKKRAPSWSHAHWLQHTNVHSWLHPS